MYVCPMLHSMLLCLDFSTEGKVTRSFCWWFFRHLTIIYYSLLSLSLCVSHILGYIFWRNVTPLVLGRLVRVLGMSHPIVPILCQLSSTSQAFAIDNCYSITLFVPLLLFLFPGRPNKWTLVLNSRNCWKHFNRLSYPKCWSNTTNHPVMINIVYNWTI